MLRTGRLGADFSRTMMKVLEGKQGKISRKVLRCILRRSERHEVLAEN